MDMIMSIDILFVIFAVFIMYSSFRAYRLAYKLSHPKRCVFEPKIKEAYTARKFDFKTEDGLTLKGIEITPKGEIKGSVIVCHYLGGSKEMALSFLDFLLPQGFRLLSFDFRNHGESQRDRSIIFSFEKDFKAFWCAVEAMHIDRRYSVIGFSIGSNVALMGAGLYDKIKAVVIDSGPLMDSKSYFCYALNNQRVKNPLVRYLFLVMYLRYAGFKNLSQKTGLILRRLNGKPLLIIQGENDHIIPACNACAAIECVSSERAALWMVPKSRHLTNHYVAKEEYGRRISGFLTGIPMQDKINL